jgi:Flp pilus assembly protein TadG
MQVRRSGQKGNAVVETALMAPWIFLLFLGVFDFGFYAYAAISTQHAARVAALYTSSSTSSVADTSGACQYVLAALKDLPNMSGVTSCAADASQISTTTPVAVTAAAATGPDSTPASTVSVLYQTVPLFPIPGLMGQMTITRTAEMKVQF